MGISLNKQLNIPADKNGNERWVLPHGMLLEVEDYFKEESATEGRRITHIFLTNKMNLRDRIIVEREHAIDDVK